jgi:hypothetical protein
MAYAYKMIEDNNTFGIYEIATEQVIKTFRDKTEARAFLRHLNLGGGFNGWTPTFFMRPLENIISTR